MQTLPRRSLLWTPCLLLCAMACNGGKGDGTDPNDRYVGTGEPGYFMAVFSLPGGAESGGAAIDWSLQLNIPANANAASALHAAKRPAAAPQALSPEWQARLSFERARRGHIDAEVARRRQGLWGADHALAACPGACDGNTMCWKGTCTATPAVKFVDNMVTVSTQVLAVLPIPGKAAKVNVLLDTNNTAGSEAQVVASAQKFIDTLPKELELLGQTDHTGSVDIDGDGRMTLVYSMENGAGTTRDVFASLAGFFSVADAAASGAESDGNVADMLWARVPGKTLATGTPVTPAMLAGTMAHEYTHLTSYGLRVLSTPVLGREVLWLDEALAHTMEDLSGWSVSNASVYATALQNWGKGGFASSDDSVEQRGRAYTLVRYLIDQAARQGGATDAASAAAFTAAKTVVSGLLREAQSGFEHPAFQAMGETGAFNWTRAVFVSGDPNQNRADAHANDFLDVAHHPITNNLLGFDPHAAYPDASGQTIPLAGPAAEDLDATAEDPTGNLDESTSVLFYVHGFDAKNVKQTAAASSIGPFFHVAQITGAVQ